MKRKRIVIKGAVVQDIGYRLFLYEYAEAVDIREFQARNIEEGVEVLVGSEDIGVDKYLDFVREEGPERAEIEEIEVEDYEGKIKPIERFAQSFMLAQMGKFVNIGLEMLATERAIKKDTGTMLEKQDSMLEKQDSMLEKQDETISEIRNVSEKIDQGKEEIVMEISALREDLKSYMENKFARIEQEITEIKMKVGMV
ncbi:MAG: acylphosphatase [Methanophagales archaeon]|nr:acylphosphatase [Methanophagales archaeon]